MEAGRRRGSRGQLFQERFWQISLSAVLSVRAYQRRPASGRGPFTVVAPDVRPESQTMRRADSALFTPAVLSLEEGPSTCKARLVICSHLDRIGLLSRSVRENVDVRRAGELLPREEERKTRRRSRSSVSTLVRGHIAFFIPFISIKCNMRRSPSAKRLL